MKFFLISDNIDTRAGMRLAGVEGVVVHEAYEVEDALEAAMQTSDLGVILITEKLAALIPERLSALKLTRELPLVVEIPDRHGTRRSKDSITRYVNESLGIKF
ncbi:MAG: V-type ATP synthase subunit F [Oscillospiraceae bacterium]|nr:V-type ATP synthase subunit F [Oscillospiraceae bacterium]